MLNAEHMQLNQMMLPTRTAQARFLKLLTQFLTHVSSVLLSPSPGPPCPPLQIAFEIPARALARDCWLFLTSH